MKVEETLRVTCVGYVEFPTRGAVRVAKCPVTTVLSVAFFLFPFFCFGRWLMSRCTVWGECSHVFHMHCLLKWIGTAASKQQCPMDRRTWGMSNFLYPVPSGINQGPSPK